MQVLGIRYCEVTSEMSALAGFFAALGMPKNDYAQDGFEGAIFPAGASWIELWKPGPQMTPSVMLQVIVDDADAFAAQARSNGLDPQGPTDAHGERIYMLTAPNGMQVSFQSALAG